MTEQVLLKTIDRAAKKQRRSNSRLLREAAAKAASIAERKEAERRLGLRRDLLVRRQMGERVRLALEGVTALCALGLSPQLQSLIEGRGKPIVLYGGEKTICAGFDMADVHWKWVAFVRLTTTHLQIHAYTETSGDFGRTFKPDIGERVLINLPYAVDGPLLRIRPLWRIATPKALEWEEVWRDDNINLTYSTTALFEVLVDCANARKLGKYFRMAIS